MDFEMLIERVRAVQDGIEGLAILEDPDAVERLVALAPAQLDTFAREIRKKAGIRRTSIEEVIKRARVRAEEPDVTPETDPALEEEADELLSDPRLLERFTESVQAGGHVGEERTAQALLLAMVTRVTDSPIHVVVKGASAAGKNHTVRAVTDHLPADQVKEITDMSPKALQYGEGFAGKVIVLVEQNAGDRSEYTLRVAMSEGSITVMVAEKNPDSGRMETREHTVECGCIISTTTRTNLNDENETRVLELTLDESPEQTRRIAEAIARHAATPPTSADRERREQDLAVWRCALGKIEPVDVVVPQAPALAEAFPVKRIRSRRDFPRPHRGEGERPPPSAPARAGPRGPGHRNRPRPRDREDDLLRPHRRGLAPGPADPRATARGLRRGRGLHAGPGLGRHRVRQRPIAPPPEPEGAGRARPRRGGGGGEGPEAREVAGCRTETDRRGRSD
jgi:hypothetical protein